MLKYPNRDRFTRAVNRTLNEAAKNSDHPHDVATAMLCAMETIYSFVDNLNGERLFIVNDEDAKK